MAKNDAKCTACGGTGLAGENDQFACRECGGTGKTRPMKVDEGVKALRKKIGRTRGSQDPFTDGTVIRWVSNGSRGQAYVYAALRAAGLWWITGGAGYYGAPTKTYEELSKILARGEVSDVVVASAWASV